PHRFEPFELAGGVALVFQAAHRLVEQLRDDRVGQWPQTFALGGRETLELPITDLLEPALQIRHRRHDREVAEPGEKAAELFLQDLLDARDLPDPPAPVLRRDLLETVEVV